MNKETELIKELVEMMEHAIRSQDWIVDGACDPDSVLRRADQHLREQGYTRDGLTGEEWVTL